jgi:hypothetical protein
MTRPESLSLQVIACRVFQHLLERCLPREINNHAIYLDSGLHRYPNNLQKALQEIIDQLTEPSLVVLGYGLCGNGLHGIKSRDHTLLIPRTDDCIAILLGSYQAYRQEFTNNPGTYYLSKGWLESGSNPLDEHREYLEKYGPERAEWIMDKQYCNYNRLALVAHNQEDLKTCRHQALDIAQFCERWGMRYVEILGSDDYVQRLVEVALDPGKTDGDFILVPPGGELQQNDFLMSCPP